MNAPLEITCGEDAQLSLAISSSAGSLGIADIITCQVDLRQAPELPPVLTKTLGAGVSVIGVTGGIVSALVSIASGDTASLTPGVSYFYSVICATAAQKNLAAFGYITVNQPTI